MLDSYVLHIVTAQIYRWFSFFESSDLALENHLELLTKKATIDTPLVSLIGGDSLERYLMESGHSRQSSHRVQNIQLLENSAKTICSKLDVLYIDPLNIIDGELMGVELAYWITFTKQAELLPRISKIEIANVTGVVLPEFEQTYAYTRCFSLANYWLALFERTKVEPHPFGELLADSFEFHFKTGVLRDLTAFYEWVSGPAANIETSSHKISNFQVEVLKPQHYQLEMDIAWQGLSTSGNNVLGRARHTWRVVDDPALRFAQLEYIDFVVTEPFEEIIET